MNNNAYGENAVGLVHGHVSDVVSRVHHPRFYGGKVFEAGTNGETAVFHSRHLVGRVDQCLYIELQ
jgi:hypothetical protein